MGRMRIMHGIAGSRLSQIYLTVVAVAIAWNWWEYLAWVKRRDEVEGTYPMLADGPPLLLTAPVSVLLNHLTPVGWSGHGSFTVCVVAGALVNAAALNGLRAWARRRRTRATAGVSGLAQR